MPQPRSDTPATKGMTMNPAHRSRIIEWVIATLFGVVVAIILVKFGLIQYPGLFILAVSLGNVIGQYVSVISGRRRDKKNEGVVR